MRRLFTLLLLSLTIFAAGTKAQVGTTCNADFNFTVTGNTAQFVPVVPGDSLSTIHQWFFGDGSPVSNAVAPGHTYGAAGVYNVKHILKRISPNGAVTCMDSVIKAVTIANTTPCNLQANFAWVRDSIQINTYYFSNLTVNLLPTDSVTWNFGDGTPASNAVNPVHVYAQPGTYNVCLRVKRQVPAGTPPCVSEVCRTLVVTPPCNLQAYFTFIADSLQTNKIYFNNATVNYQPGDSLLWNFGDGSVGYGTNPMHIYTAPGTYTVCLKVLRFAIPGTAPCVSDYCKTIVIQPQVQPCNLVANFIWRQDSTGVNKILFNNTSAGFQAGDSIRWTFGDGTSSFDLNPAHVYAQPGTYTVCLRVKRNSTTPNTPPCVSEICKVVVVLPQVQPCNLVANFIWRQDSTGVNRILFNNTSAGFQAGDSIRWTFGDGTSSFDLNPAHVYTQPGTYTVCLRVKRNSSNATTPPCVSEICKVVVVVPQVQPCNLVANFNWFRDSTGVNRIQFINTSGGFQAGDSIRWTFGDGTSSLDLNPAHVYQQPGTYTVCLRVKRMNTAGAAPCVSEICKTVVVLAQVQPCNLAANFTWRKDSTNANKIFFTNTSFGFQSGDSIRWTFGDGTSSLDLNPTHVYTQPGTYTVCLRVKRNSTIPGTAPCVSEVCKMITVGTPCDVTATFNFERLATSPSTYVFRAVNINPAYQYTWTFGDGTTGQGAVVTHNYQQGGNYTVCLKVIKNNTCFATSCRTISVVTQFNCNNINVNFVYQRDAFMPNKLYFFAISNFPLLQQRWTITKLPTATSPISPIVTLYQNNPVYVFTDTGLYRVCLRTVTLGGCVKETCQLINITQVLQQQCQLYAYPNPAQSSVNVNVYLTQAQNIYAYVYNSQNILMGQKVQAGVTGNNVVNINVANLAPGTYTIKLIYGNKTCIARFQKI